MTDEEAVRAIETFLTEYDKAMTEYDQGYADADATLSVIEMHVTALRDSVSDDEEPEAEGEPGSESDGM